MMKYTRATKETINVREADIREWLRSNGFVVPESAKITIKPDNIQPGFELTVTVLEEIGVQTDAGKVHL